ARTVNGDLTRDANLQGKLDGRRNVSDERDGTAFSRGANGEVHRWGDSHRFENAIRSAAFCQFEDLLRCVGFAGIDDVRRAELSGEVELVGGNINGNDLRTFRE